MTENITKRAFLVGTGAIAAASTLPAAAAEIPWSDVYQALISQFAIDFGRQPEECERDMLAHLVEYNRPLYEAGHFA